MGAERSAEHRRAADARLRSLLPLVARLRLSPDRSCALELPAAHAVEDQLRDGRRSTGAGHHRQPTVLGEPVQPEVLADPIVIHPIPSRSALARRADDAIGSRAAAGRAARVRRRAAAVRRVAGARRCCGRGGHARVAALRQEADWPTEAIEASSGHATDPGVPERNRIVPGQLGGSDRDRDPRVGRDAHGHRARGRAPSGDAVDAADHRGAHRWAFARSPGGRHGAAIPPCLAAERRLTRRSQDTTEGQRLCGSARHARHA